MFKNNDKKVIVVENPDGTINHYSERDYGSLKEAAKVAERENPNKTGFRVVSEQDSTSNSPEGDNTKKSWWRK